MVDGHIIADVNGFNYIVDTGSPVSFGHETTFVIEGKSFSINDDSFGPVTVDSINKLSGLQVDGLIGMDIMTHFNIRFTRTDITFSEKPILHTHTAIKLPIAAAVMGIPIITLNIGGNDEKIYFDTGAKISYLSDDLLVGRSLGEMDDFYFTIGKYKTKVYEIGIKINGQVEKLTFGSLPPSLRVLLGAGQTKGVIGSQLLDKYSIILSHSNKTLILEPSDQQQNSDLTNAPSPRKMNLVREPSLD